MLGGHNLTMSKCDHCGKQCGLPYNCSYCGGSYCSDHRFPPNHNCIKEAKWRNDERWRNQIDGSGSSNTEKSSPPSNPRKSDTPLKYCVFCGGATSKIFYCPHCGHEYCSVHKLPNDHNCISTKRNEQRKSASSSRTRSPSKSKPTNIIPIAIFVIVAIIVGALGAYVVNSYINDPAGSDATNPQTSDTKNSQPLAIVQSIIPQTNYETGLISKSYGYAVRGKSDSISVNLYSGVYNKISSEGTPPSCVRYNHDTSPCTSDEIQQSYLKFIDDQYQKKDLDNLINSIKAKTSIKDDQARIAISLVQNIPYDYSKLYTVSTDMRYPYEVLYDNTGICAEKSVLLAYLLRGLGYGVVLFEFKAENHMAVGIKSPSQYSYLNSGYAFIESTSPTIITDSQGNYVGAGKLTSTPQIFQISEGNSMTSISEEYQDSISYNQLGTGRTLAPVKYKQWEMLVWKYGLIMSDGTTVTENPSNKPLCDNNGILCNGECYNNCGSHMIGKCTPSGVICEYEPNYCPPGLISCNGKCWQMCYGSTPQCTAQGLVCYQ